MPEDDFNTFNVGDLDVGDTFITTGYWGGKNGIYEVWKKMEDQGGVASWCESVFSSKHGSGTSFKNDVKVIRVVFSIHRC